MTLTDAEYTFIVDALNSHGRVQAICIAANKRLTVRDAVKRISDVEGMLYAVLTKIEETRKQPLALVGGDDG